ncbi:MAG: signal peptidase II [Pseudomonadota bacterium]|nr:signal peptidase II [Pseudomonadota bacterium]
MRLLSLTFIIFLIFIDYLSKKLIKNNFDHNFYMINEYISIQILYNKGIAFSLFNSTSIVVNTILILIISIIILFLLYIFIKDFSRLSRTELLGYMFLIGGATGNFLDRLINGSVLDFLIINYNQIYFPAVFNVADIFISFGALLIITNYVFRSNK